MLATIKSFLHRETSSGILLMVATVLALICANSPLGGLYIELSKTHFGFHFGDLGLDKELIHWINDGLMAIFFFLVGLELKREFLQGELSSLKKVILPLFGAAGGMAIPALIYVFINRDNPSGMRGWAIPAATDIAFALGVLALLGSRVPLGLKVFLVSLAIMDDVGAIVIIAVFYTADLSLTSMGIAVALLVILTIINRSGVRSPEVYIVVGLILWTAVLQSGVHATLAGVVLAFFIPMTGRTPDEPSPLRSLEHRLHPWVAFVILPIFAFANAGVPLAGLSLASLAEPVPLGIALGLFVGKQIGVFGFSWVAIKLGWADLPKNVHWLGLYGVSILTGIGFTMSLFIAGLAFPGVGDLNDRLGILCGSFLSSLVGFVLLRMTLKPLAQKDTTIPEPLANH